MKSGDAAGSDDSAASAAPVNLLAQPLASSAPTSEELERLKKSNHFISFVLVKDAAGIWRFNRIKTDADLMQNKTVWRLEPAPIEADAAISPQVVKIQQLLAAAKHEDLLDNKSTVNAQIQTLMMAYNDQIKRRKLLLEFLETESDFMNFTRQFLVEADKLPKNQDTDIFMEKYKKLAAVDFFAGVNSYTPQATTIDEFVLLKAKALIDTLIIEQADGSLAMTPAFDDRLKSFTDAAILYKSFFKIFGEESELQKYAIMPIQRVMRYDLLSKEMASNLEKIPATTPAMQTLKDSVVTRFRNIVNFTQRSNEAQRNVDSMQKLLSTQAVLGKMVRDARTLVSAKDSNQKQIVDKFLTNITAIAEEIIKDKFYFSNTRQNKIIQAKDKFYEVFMNTFIEATLLHKDQGVELESTLLQYMKNIDKKLQAEGLPGIMFEKIPVFSPTAANVFATVKQADAEVVQRIVGKMFDDIQTMIDQTPPDTTLNPDHALAYKNALAVLKAMGPDALVIWNQNAAAKFNGLAQPTANDYKKILDAAKLDQVWNKAGAVAPSKPAAVANVESSKLATQDILAKMADEIKKRRPIAAKYGFTQLQIWDTLANDIQAVSQKIVEQGNAITPEAFYQPFMKAFVHGYIVHEKTQNDVFSDCIRGFVVTMDKYFQQAGMAGVIHAKSEDLPRGTRKDLPALQTLKLRNNDTFQQQIVEDLFKNLKAMVESPLHSDYEKRVYHRTVNAINAMGVKAVMLWNLHADKEFFELTIPATKKYKDLFQLGHSETQRREALVSMVNIEFGELQNANADLPMNSAIPDSLMNTFSAQLQQAIYKSKSRSDLNEQMKLALLKLISQTYVQGKAPALKLVEGFVQRVEKRLANNKQRGIFVSNPEDLKSFSLLTSYSITERILEQADKLSTQYLNRYLQNFYVDFKKMMQQSRDEKLFVRAVKLLEKTGPGAKEIWNALARQDSDPIARQISLPDTRVVWSENKATIMAQAKLNDKNAYFTKRLDELMASEIANLGPAPTVANTPGLFHPAAPTVPTTKPSGRIIPAKPSHAAPRPPVIEPSQQKVLADEKPSVPPLPKVESRPALPKTLPPNKKAVPPAMPLTKPTMTPKKTGEITKRPPIPKSPPQAKYDPHFNKPGQKPPLPASLPPSNKRNTKPRS